MFLSLPCCPLTGSPFDPDYGGGMWVMLEPSTHVVRVYSCFVKNAARDNAGATCGNSFDSGSEIPVKDIRAFSDVYRAAPVLGPLRVRLGARK